MDIVREDMTVVELEKTEKDADDITKWRWEMEKPKEEDVYILDGYPASLGFPVMHAICTQS